MRATIFSALVSGGRQLMRKFPPGGQINLPSSSETMVVSGGQRRPKMMVHPVGSPSTFSAYRNCTLGWGSGLMAVLAGLCISVRQAVPATAAFSRI